MTANILQTEKGIDGQARILVSLTDGITYKTNPEWVTVTGLNLEQVKNLLLSKVTTIKGSFDFIDTVQLGALDLTITPPTQAELDKQQFKNDVNRLQLLRLFKDPTDKEVIDLLDKINAEYKPEYI